MSKHVPEPIARPTRTTIQGAIALGLVTFWSAHIDHLRRDELTLWVLVVTALVNAAWVYVENKTGRAILRQIPPLDVPVADDDKPKRRARRSGREG